MQKQKSIFNDLNFSTFAKIISELVGNNWVFSIAFMYIVIWLMTGPIFNYSDTWQLVVNTSTSIITFLVVFLIQNTQNRETKIINLKLDELIRAIKEADTTSIDLEKLSDEQLEELEKHYQELCNQHKKN